MSRLFFSVYTNSVRKIETTVPSNSNKFIISHSISDIHLLLNNSLPSKYYFEQKHNVPLDIKHPLLNNSLPSKHLLRPFANFLYRDIESTSRLLPLSLLGRHPLIQNLTRLAPFLTTTLRKTILSHHWTPRDSLNCPSPILLDWRGLWMGCFICTRSMTCWRLVKDRRRRNTHWRIFWRTITIGRRTVSGSNCLGEFLWLKCFNFSISMEQSIYWDAARIRTLLGWARATI